MFCQAVRQICFRWFLGNSNISSGWGFTREVVRDSNVLLLLQRRLMEYPYTIESTALDEDRLNDMNMMTVLAMKCENVEL